MRGGKQAKCEGRERNKRVLNANVQPENIASTKRKGRHWSGMGRLAGRGRCSRCGHHENQSKDDKRGLAIIVEREEFSNLKKKRVIMQE